MKYKYIGTEEQLIEHGFNITDNSYGKDGFDECFEAIKKVDERYEIVLQDKSRDLIVYVFDKNEDMYLNEMFDDHVDVTPYIQELIKANLVEVME